MSSFDVAAFLARTWLKGLPVDAVRVVASRMQWRRKRSGQHLFLQGDAPDGFYVVVAGRVRLYGDGAGAEALLNIAGPGMAFGEISVIDEGPRTHGAQCRGATQLLYLSAADFMALLGEVPAFHLHVTRRLCRHVRMAFAALQDEVTLPLVPRLAKRLVLLARLYGPRQELTQDDLAHMLGTARQTVGKPLRDWERQGWIALEYRKIAVLDSAALEAVARTREGE
jgi:CRP-like cAMP-binding protein